MEIPEPYNFKLKGRVGEVFKMINLLAETIPLEWLTRDYWESRLYASPGDSTVSDRRLKEIIEEGELIWMR